MISPVGNDPLPLSQAQQSAELTAIVKGYIFDDPLSSSAYWWRATNPFHRPQCATRSVCDVPDEVLAQLGSRVQHQLREHTPNDAWALKQTVATFPKSHDDLAEAFQQLGIGEAIVTVMDPDGAAPMPVAWTPIRGNSRAVTDPWKRRSAGAWGPPN